MVMHDAIRSRLSLETDELRRSQFLDMASLDLCRSELLEDDWAHVALEDLAHEDTGSVDWMTGRWRLSRRVRLVEQRWDWMGWVAHGEARQPAAAEGPVYTLLVRDYSNVDLRVLGPLPATLFDLLRKPRSFMDLVTPVQLMSTATESALRELIVAQLAAAHAARFIVRVWPTDATPAVEAAAASVA
jgi:hypothetical protein